MFELKVRISMVNALLVIHIILAVCMIALVLLQKSEGGALGMGGGSGGGMGGFMSARGTANLLTRTTGVLATLFFLTTVGLAVLYKGGANRSILDEVATEKSAVPQSSPEGVPDEVASGSLDPAQTSDKVAQGDDEAREDRSDEVPSDQVPTAKTDENPTPKGAS